MKTENPAAKVQLTATQAYALCMRVGAYNHPAAQVVRHYSIASVRRLIALGLLKCDGKPNVRKDVWEATPTAAGRAWAMGGAAC